MGALGEPVSYYIRCTEKRAKLDMEMKKCSVGCLGLLEASIYNIHAPDVS